MGFIKSKVLKLFQHQLITNGLVMMSGGIIANVANYLYHLLMGRFLGPAKYGELESVISVLYLLIIAVTTLSLVVTKIVADLKNKKDLSDVRWIFSFFTQKIIIFGGGFTLALIFFSPFFASFLNLGSFFPLVIAMGYFLSSLLTGFNRSILQGLLRFKEMVTSTIFENSLKVVIAVFLVFLGLQVNGAISALFLGSFFAYLFTLFLLRSIRRLSPVKPDIIKGKIFAFAIPVFLANLSFTSLYTNDVILVKHFFSAHEAGLYAALAVLGKIVFFASSAIATVMFPMVADHRSQGKSYKHLLYLSFLMVFFICSGTEVIYLLFPKLMVSLLFGKEYLSVAFLVGWMGLFISVYSLSFLLVNFFLSIEKTKVVILPLAAAAGQIVFIWLFHNSLLQVIQISLLSSVILLFGLMLYYGYDQKKTAFGDHPRV